MSTLPPPTPTSDRSPASGGTRETEEPRVVFIVSRAHSGSTLLDLLLSTHPAVFSVGEAKMFAREPDKRCTCGAEHWTACPFWTRVDERMRADGGPGVAHPDIESDDPETFAPYNRRFFRAVSAVSGCPIIVDSSKDFARLRRFLESGLPVEGLHLLRDPRGVVSSNLRRGGRLGRECRTYVREHLAAAHALRRHPHLEVRYEDLAGDPERELARLLARLGLALQPGQLAGWKARERHNFGGNHMRFDSSEEIRPDERWRAELTSWQQLAIRARTLPVRFRRGVGVELMYRLLVAGRG